MNYPVTPPSASNFASEVDLVFYGLCILTVVFTVLEGDRHEPLTVQESLQPVPSVGLPRR